MERVGNIVQTIEGGAPGGWKLYGEGYQGYSCWLHNERNWQKLDIAFLKFLSFRLGTTVPFCQENTRLESDFVQIFSLLAQEQDPVKWDEQQHQSRRDHANQLTELKHYEDELAW